MSGVKERTFVMVKPDGVQRGLVAEVMGRFERKGFKLEALKMTRASPALLQQHYSELSSKPFFLTLLAHMASAPVVCMVWSGVDAVRQGRRILGSTNPLESPPGTLRGDFCLDVGRNMVHGSDSVAAANREIDLWFEKGEICEWECVNKPWIYE